MNARRPRGIRLDRTGLDLSGLDLSGIDLSGVEIRRATGELVRIGELVDRPTIIVALRYYG